MRWVVAGVSVWLTATGPAAAQEFAQQSAVLKEIRETANDICDKVNQEGQRSATTLSGDVEAKLNGAISKFVDLGIKGAAVLIVALDQGAIVSIRAPRAGRDSSATCDGKDK